MKHLLTINPRNVSEQEAKNYSFREAARAVVVDGENRIALLHVSKRGYYKLPGGGIEEGEDRIAALKRECVEEIGCSVEVLGEIGSTTEFWKEDVQKEISYCYFVRVIGDKGQLNLTENEKNHGFEAVWFPYEQVLELMRGSKPTDYNGEYIVPRDLAFLEEAKIYMQINHAA